MRTFVHLFVVCLDIVKHNHDNKSEAETQTKVGNTDQISKINIVTFW